MVPSACVSVNMDNLQFLALGYIPAVLPIVLVFVVYAAIEIHGRNYRPLVWCWKPFGTCSIKLRRRFNPKTSVVNIFATFLLLGFTRLIFISLQILQPESLVDMYGNTVKGSVVYFQPSVTYFTREHIPFTIMAITVLILFSIIILFLLCYTTCLCRKIKSSVCSSYDTTVVQIFADAFLGSYKDGTNGESDYRWFCGASILFRVVIIILTLNVAYLSTYFFLVIILCVVFSLMFALLQPYKQRLFNAIDSLAFSLIALLHLLLLMQTHLVFITGGVLNLPLVYAFELLSMLPLVYLATYTLHWLLFKKTNIGQKVVHRFKSCCHTSYDQTYPPLCHNTSTTMNQVTQ